MALPVGDAHSLLIADDGAAGVVAVTWRVPGFGGEHALRFFHVLEQGRLDPSLPPAGVPFLTGADLPGNPEMWAMRVISDAAGGAYVLAAVCAQVLGGYDCNVQPDIRLMHVTSQGVSAPNWPPLGIDLGPGVQVGTGDWVDICSDASSGVILAWIDPADSTVRAQRFASGGSTLWSGGLNGLVVLATHTYQAMMRLGGSHVGGCSVVTSQGAVDGLFQLRAGRVDATGALPWTSSGRAVITQPAYSSIVQSASVDDQGRTLIAAFLSTLDNGTHLAYTQLLATTGVRLWSQFGASIGPQGIADPRMAGLVAPSGYLTVHADPSGRVRFQLQDETGSMGWDPDSNGTVATWATPPSSAQSPIAAPDGHVLSVWQDHAGGFSIRAIELDESGAVAAGWPAGGAVVCGSPSARLLADAMVSRSQLFVAMGSQWSGPDPIVQRLSRAVLTVNPDLPARPIELSQPAPNPSRGEWLVRLALRTGARVTLEAFDVAGRRALAVDLGALAAGWHALEAPGGASLAPGVYRVRVRAGAHVAERVLVKIR